ncbi:MAG: histone deacetylase family protein [Ignisphaera sp.]
MFVIVVKNALTKHIPPYYHPENPLRMSILLQTIEKLSISADFWVNKFDEEEAIEIASRVHAKGYVDDILGHCKKGFYELDSDTYITSNTCELALETLYYSYELANTANNIFVVLSRPPGHHAGLVGRAMGASTNGFCIFNNAVASVLGFRDRNLKRIAVIDFDAHHGNGTMEIFYKEKILHIDIHQDPSTLYPFTGYPTDIGEGDGYGYKANFILRPRSTDESLTHIIPLVETLINVYTPEALVVSAGFDGYRDDGLANLALTSSSFHILGSAIKRFRVPTVIVLEGGYSTGLEHGFKAFLEGLQGIEKNYTIYTDSLEILHTNLGIAKKVYDVVLSHINS